MKLFKSKTVLTIEEHKKGEYIIISNGIVKEPAKVADILLAALCQYLICIAKIANQPVTIYRAAAISEIKRILSDDNLKKLEGEN